MGPIVHVVDDDPEVLKSLARVLLAAGYQVAASGSANAFFETFSIDTPGCIVLDLMMPGFGGLEIRAELARRGVSPSIVFISGVADVPTTVRAMKCGPVDFLTKPVALGDLVDAVSRAIAKDCEARESKARRDNVRVRFNALTARELEVLSKVLTGQRSLAIAQSLGISLKTAKVHRASVMQKLQVRSIAELVRVASEAGFQSIDTRRPLAKVTQRRSR